MTTVYLIPPGTRIAVSKDGSDFNVRTAPQLQFSEPPEVAHTHAVFSVGKKRLRVVRADVFVSRYDGQGGWNQFGI